MTNKIDIKNTKKDIIEIKNLSLKYKDLLVFNNVSMNIYKGEHIGIIGKNGAGKTSLIESILGLNKVSKNTKIIINNEYKNHIGCVFQDVAYDSELTLKEIYKFYMNISNQEIDYKIFNDFGLENFINKHFKSLSGGQKQKFKLLMVLSLKPKLLILDELSTSLDFEWRKEIIVLINNYLKNHIETVLILVSHDFNELKSLCDKFYLVENKNIKYIKNIKEFFNYEHNI